MSRFFINRPIFAWVIAIIMMLAGLLAIKTLPVSQYPAIAPPQITIIALYPGASAQTVQDTVTQVIEQKMNGIDNLIYMSSSSDSAGSVGINLTFRAGTDPNMAQVQVQNKLQLATPLLPEIVQRQGISVVKSTKNFMLVIGFVSEDGSMSRFELCDYMVSNIQDIISRVEGVGELQVFGTQNTMRIWMNPEKLNNFKLTPNDVIAAIRDQNAQVSAGQFGGAPYEKGQQLNATITAQTMLQTPEEFESIILRTNSDGSTVTLKDVAKCRIGSEIYDIQAHYNKKQSAAIGIRLAAGANALDTAVRVKAKMAELEKFFPPGMKVIYQIGRAHV
jgi:multidrug efflux pump